MKFKTLQDWKLNFNLGMIAFVFHRLTGLALVLYIVLHIWSISHIMGGPEFFDKMMGAYDSTMGHVIEWLLLLAVLWHMFNGLRITVTDFLRFSHHQKTLIIWVFVISGAIGLGSLFKFIPALKPLLGL